MPYLVSDTVYRGGEQYQVTHSFDTWGQVLEFASACNPNMPKTQKTQVESTKQHFPMEVSLANDGADYRRLEIVSEASNSDPKEHLVSKNIVVKSDKSFGPMSVKSVRGKRIIETSVDGVKRRIPIGKRLPNTLKLLSEASLSDLAQDDLDAIRGEVSLVLEGTGRIQEEEAEDDSEMPDVSDGADEQNDDAESEDDEESSESVELLWVAIDGLERELTKYLDQPALTDDEVEEITAAEEEDPSLEDSYGGDIYAFIDHWLVVLEEERGPFDGSDQSVDDAAESDLVDDEEDDVVESSGEERSRAYQAEKEAAYKDGADDGAVAYSKGYSEEQAFSKRLPKSRRWRDAATLLWGEYQKGIKDGYYQLVKSKGATKGQRKRIEKDVRRAVRRKRSNPQESKKAWNLGMKLGQRAKRQGTRLSEVRNKVTSYRDYAVARSYIGSFWEGVEQGYGQRLGESMKRRRVTEDVEQDVRDVEYGMFFEFLERIIYDVVEDEHGLDADPYAVEDYVGGVSDDTLGTIVSTVLEEVAAANGFPNDVEGFVSDILSNGATAETVGHGIVLDGIGAASIQDYLRGDAPGLKIGNLDHYLTLDSLDDATQREIEEYFLSGDMEEDRKRKQRRRRLKEETDYSGYSLELELRADPIENVEEDADEGDELAQELLDNPDKWLELEKKAYSELKRALSPFGSVTEEGHGTGDALIVALSLNDVREWSTALDALPFGASDGEGQKYQLTTPYHEVYVWGITTPDGESVSWDDGMGDILADLGGMKESKKRKSRRESVNRSRNRRLKEEQGPGYGRVEFIKEAEETAREIWQEANGDLDAAMELAWKYSDEWIVYYGEAVEFAHDRWKDDNSAFNDALDYLIDTEYFSQSGEFDYGMMHVALANTMYRLEIEKALQKLDDGADVEESAKRARRRRLRERSRKAGRSSTRRSRVESYYNRLTKKSDRTQPKRNATSRRRR